jgi:hypothetical protein
MCAQRGAAQEEQVDVLEPHALEALLERQPAAERVADDALGLGVSVPAPPVRD